MDTPERRVRGKRARLAPEIAAHAAGVAAAIGPRKARPLSPNRGLRNLEDLEFPLAGHGLANPRTARYHTANALPSSASCSRVPKGPRQRLFALLASLARTPKPRHP